MQGALKYLWNIVHRWRPIRRLVTRTLIAEKCLTAFLKRHPIIALLLLVSIGATSLAWPDIRAALLSRECHVVSRDALFKSDGDNLEFGDDRKCQHGQVIAVEYFHFGGVERDKLPPIDLVTEEIFISNVALNIDEAGWHLYSIFRNVDNFPQQVRPEKGFMFSGQTCRSAGEESFKLNNAQIREGLLFRGVGRQTSGELRAVNPVLWDRCNHGVDEKDPLYKTCDYRFLEYFVPTVSPIKWCERRTFWQKWFGPNTSARMPDSKAYAELRILAQHRWKKDAEPVAKERWLALSKDLPKVCMRSVLNDKDDKPSPWEEVAVVGAFWCDN